MRELVTKRPTRRIALVHDFLLDLRGGERVFLELCAMWPEADVFTAVYDERGTEGRFSHREINVSFLQHLRPTARTFRGLLPLYPAAIESLDLSGYDIVVSSSSAWAHGVRCSQPTVHISYCHNPFRYAWNEQEETLARRNRPARFLMGELFERWRRWDWAAAQRTDRYIANARTTQSRVRAYFGRESQIVYPPVRTERFSPGAVADHYVVVGELMAHKQVDVAIEAFNKLRLPLHVVGDGPDYRRLRRLAGSTIHFNGRISDGSVAEVLSSARALIITSVEEFGITAVESQAAGRPVIARAAGGALETVLDGVTGRLWSGGPDRLAEAVVRFDDAAIDPDACVQNAARFDSVAFRRGVRAEIRAALAGQRSAVSARDPLPATRPVGRDASATQS